VGWRNVSTISAASGVQIRQGLIREPVQGAGCHVVLQLPIPVGRIKLLKPGSEPRTIGGRERLNRRFDGLKVVHPCILRALQP
jgi:hypothetical protein